MRSVEIFAGAGGLALGMANAGFEHAAVVEWDQYACETFRQNQRRHNQAVETWPVHEVDARSFDFTQIPCDIAVVSGGPPCQPFSMGGKHLAQDDTRNMFPEAVRAVRDLMPKAFIFENVKGLTRESFTPYFSYIHLQLQYPEIMRREYEDWVEHRSRLEKHHSSNKNAPSYKVLFNVLNAADYGVPQKRERVFFVGFRSDLNVEWEFPKKTHSSLALIRSKWIDGDYWAKHRISHKLRPIISKRQQVEIDRLSAAAEVPLSSLRWNTTRDALMGLPDPETHANNRILNHGFVPGARSYVGHTGSLLDEPAKTLKAGQHGVPGGENMFVKDDGTVRYFTLREAARIQTFPDDFEFYGSWSQSMRQLGNAVPVKLAEVVASSVATSLRNLEKSI